MTARRSPAFPMPRGWFRVAFAEAVPPDTCAALRYFGRDLVLHVDAGSVPVLRDASGTDAWPTRLRNGIVWAWHGPDGAAPDWEIPEVPEVGHTDWTPLVHRRWRVRTRCQEIAENTADPAHFGVVHGFPSVSPPELAFDAHRFRSVTRFDSVRHDGTPLASTLEVTWHGLGLGVTRTTGVLDLVFLGTSTPIDADAVETCFSFTVCRARGFDPDAGAGRASIAEAVRQMEQDIPIWENKCYRPQPVLCEGDGPIGRFREWAAQFHR